jgi:hypothetical protein
MRFSHFFIERPIFAAVPSILITIAGALRSHPKRDWRRWAANEVRSAERQFAPLNLRWA